MIKITANSKEYEVQESTSIASFIQAFGFNPQKCVIEYNGKAMRYLHFSNLLLKEGDKLEIMSLVAGG